MFKRFRLNPLFLFLLLSAAFLFSAFPQIKEDLWGAKNYVKNELEIDNLLSYPLQEIEKTERNNIYPYSSSLTLYYSVDGGEHFQKASNNKVDLENLKNPHILFRNTSIRWRHPFGNFPSYKSLVVKLIDEEKGQETEEKVLTYPNAINGTFPEVHITIPEKGLFGWNEGLMIYGNESTQDNKFHKDWWYRSANFASRGSDWERKVTFQYFDKGKLKVEQECGLKISGNATRYFPQKSLKLYPIEENGKRTKLKFPFFDKNGNKATTSMLLRQSGNDNNKTLFADLLMHKLAKESNVLALDGYPISVYLNGNYWGIYNFRERIDPYFIAKKENEESDEVTILFCEIYGDRTQLKDGKKKIKKAFDELIDKINQQETLSNENYEVVSKEIDLESFTDYILLECFYGNQDWLYNNTTWYKTGDKKWKWVLNDLDYSLAYSGETNLNSNLFEKLKTGNSITGQLFNALISNEKYKAKFKERATELMVDNFSDEKIENTFFDLKSIYEPEIDLQIRRWRFIDSKEQWEKDCDKNVTFLRERRTMFLKQVANL